MYRPINVDLIPAPGLDLQNDGEQAKGALVSTNIRRDNVALKPCHPTMPISTDGSTAIIGLHFHWQRDASIMRVSASDKLYLDGTAAKSVVTGSDYTI